MNNDPATCPKCGGAIPADAPQGLCPRCVLAGVAAPTEVTRTTGPRVAAPPIESVRAAFPQLEILELIGQGGMGVVYKARQPKLDRLVALKILSGNLATDAAFGERFAREARTLAKLNHPNIVTIYDHGRAGEFFYLLMEFVDGVNLRQAMAAGRFTASEALALVPRICEALQYAHEEGVLHRDIKPENILLDGRGRVKIADFGIAKMLGEALPGGTLTASGAALGTPHYMAPEQIEKPAEVDHRADIFSLGVVFYEMLTGELPLGRFGPPSAKSAVDRRVDEIVFRTLEKERELRQQSAGEVRSQVETVAAGIKSGAAAPRSGFSEPAAPLRTGTAYVSTPEHLRTFWGGQYIYTGKGALTLDRERLTFVRDSAVTTIPLKSITGLTLGTYPRLTKPTGLNYIAVAFDEAGTKRLLLFTPHRSPWNSTWTTNSVVTDWHQVLREATAHAQGREPEPVPAELLHVPENFSHIIIPILVLLAVFIGGLSMFGLVLVLAKSGLRGLSGTELIAMGGAMLWVAVLVGVLLFVAKKLRNQAPEHPGSHRDQDLAKPRTSSGWGKFALLFTVVGISAFLTSMVLLSKPWRRSTPPPLILSAKELPLATPVQLPVHSGAVRGKPSSPPPVQDPIRDIELKVATQQLEKTLNELADAQLELATSESMLAVTESHSAKKALLERIRYLEERSAVLRKELRAGSPNKEAGEAVVFDLEIFVTRDQYEKTLTALVEAKKELATSPAMMSYSDNHPTKKALVTKIQFLEERLANLKKFISSIWMEDRLKAPVMSPTTAQNSFREIELKVATQQLEKSLNELADAQLELATSESMLAVTESHPAKKALLERLRYLDERTAILRGDLQAGSSSPEAGEAVVHEVGGRVARDQYEKTLTALVEAKKELATSPAMMSYSDNHPTKKALLTKIRFLEERQAVLRNELSSAQSTKPTKP